jgi:tetratricopeptide (TPR) repeat protein
MAMSQERSARTGERHPPFHAGTLGSFGQRAGDEAIEDGDRDGVEAAYRALTAALELNADADERWKLRHEAAAKALAWFHHGGPNAAVELAVTHGGVAVDAAGEDHRRLVLSRDTLARALSEHARLTETRAAEDRAIAAWRALVADSDAPVTTRGRAGQQLNLASELGATGAKRGDRAMIDEALRVLDALEGGDVDVGMELAASRGNRLRARYELTGVRADLDAAVASAERAANLARATEPPVIVSRMLNNLAVKLRDRHSHYGDRRDIDRSVTLQEEALALVPAAWHERSRWEGNLGHAYRQLAEITGRADHLERAESYARAALEATSPELPEYWEHLNSYLVATSAWRERLGRPARRADCAGRHAGEPTGHPCRHAPPARQPRRPARGPLRADRRPRRRPARAVAVARRHRQQRKEQPGLSRAPHLDRKRARAARERDRKHAAPRRGGRRAAPRRGRPALAPGGRPGYGTRAYQLRQLGLHLRRRRARPRADRGRDRRGEPRPRDHPGGPACGRGHAALGNARLTAFEIGTRHHGRIDLDLAERTLSAYRAAVDALEPGDPRYAPQAGNLANGLFQIGTATRNVGLLEDAANWYQRATSGPLVTGRPEQLTNLGMAALTVAAQVEDPARTATQLEVARAALDDAAAVVRPSQLAVRFRVALGRARLAAQTGDDEALVEAAERALELGREGIRASHAHHGESHLGPAERLPALGALAYLRTRGVAAAVDHLERARTLLLRDELHRASCAGATAPPPALGPGEVQQLAGRLGEPVAYLVAGPDGGQLIACTEAAIAATPLPRMRTGAAARLAQRLRFLSPGQPAEHEPRFMAAVDDAVAQLGEWAGAELAALVREHGAVTLVPVGDLVHLPWSAATVAGDGDAMPLLGLGPVRIAASATLLDAAVGHARAAGAVRQTGRVLAVPERPGVPALAHSAPEAEAVARLLTAAGYQVDRLVGDGATLRAVEAELDQVDVLHCACHTFGRLRARDSALLLSDGELRAERVVAAAAPPALVFLSACSTGRVELPLADEGISFGSSLLAGGVQSVVSTLWPVDDAASADLAEGFYRAWLAGAGVPEALAAAQREMASGIFASEPWMWAGSVAGGA